MAKTMKNKPAATMDEYIAGFPKDTQKDAGSIKSCHPEVGTQS